jgi:acetylglutamate kinase
MIRVVKIGGRAQSDPALIAKLAAAARAPETSIVIVHGGGDEVTRLQRRLGVEPRFTGGRRVTSAEEVELVRMVLSGSVNKRLVRQLLAAGVGAVGVSGEDGALLAAELLEDGALGAVGVPTGANVRLLDALLAAGFVPVVSPLGRDAQTGEGLNINGDDAAAALAVALGAGELLLLADVAGVLDDRGDPIRQLDLEAIDRLVEHGIARDGMSAKLEAARRALQGGVRTVRIGDASALVSSAAGTFITYHPSVV